MTELESDQGRPLTEEENAAVRQLLDKDRRVAWFWSTTRVFAGWVAAVVAAYFAGKQIISEFLR